jgi:hypothetical protein
MRYAVYLLWGDIHQDLERTIEAAGPREAAQVTFDELHIHADEQFPQLVVVPAEQVEVFTRDDWGRAVTMTEDLPRVLAKGAPRLRHVRRGGARRGARCWRVASAGTGAAPRSAQKAVNVASASP